MRWGRHQHLPPPPHVTGSHRSGSAWKGGSVTLPRRRHYEDRGASAVEYSLVAVALAAIIVVVLLTIGTKVRDSFTSGCSAWNSAASATESCS